MNKNDTLHIVWTSSDPTTVKLMVFMYATNSLLKGWWKHVHVIMWGGATKLFCEDAEIRAKVRAFIEAGGDVSACRRCAEELGAVAEIESFGDIELFYIGEHFTKILKEGERVLTF
ncbi:MAG: DsrE family protein [Deltaproteobacteria bacterium]|nr:DsrE family protein [Deltaproteobacteria bacterium]